MGVVCEQMKWLVCNKLASCLRMKSSSNASAPSIIARKTSGIDLGVFQQNVQQPAAVAGNNSDQLLTIVATGTKGKAMSSVRIQQLFSFIPGKALLSACLQLNTSLISQEYTAEPEIIVWHTLFLRLFNSVGEVVELTLFALFNFAFIIHIHFFKYYVYVKCVRSHFTTYKTSCAVTSRLLTRGHYFVKE